MDKAELRRIEEHGADFFVTGNEYIRDGLDLKFIPCEHPEHPDACCVGGVVLANDKQDLSQSFVIAKEVFEHVKLRTIKFVLIGLSPYIIPTADEEPLTAWDVQTNAPILEEYIKLCRDNGAKPVAVVLPVNPTLKKTYNADVLNLFRDTIKKVVGKYKANFLDLLDVNLDGKCFNNKAQLNPEGAATLSALLSSKLYFANIISLKSILDADNEYFSVLDKYFPIDRKKLINHIFCRLACDDYKRLSETLSKDDLLDLMVRVFSEMTYDHLANLTNMLPKDDFNELADRIFKISAEKISRKDKIKVWFYFSDSSMWCGDDLYNLFAGNERFEPMVFTGANPHIIEKFKAHGVKAFHLGDRTLSISEPDILFSLMPYANSFPKPFRFVNLKVTTLLASFPYSLVVCDRPNFYNMPFFRVLYKNFASSPIELELVKKVCNVFSSSRMVYSGYTKMDFFFRKDAKFHFDWKMDRPDAKKIIWAPHHSVKNNGPLLSTFHWNYKFMYEFAKAHPEISWVVKPHANTFRYFIHWAKLFSSLADYQEYLKKWDDLPNAQVYTGPYYQDIFATSDGMIQDCGSFIAEYQYVDKPMIYLTRDTQKFNDLGNEILKASYTVDGKDLDAIAAMMQRVFIEGDDYKAAERKKVFDKYLNYPKYNSMLASEFIYKSITDDLKVVPT